MPNSFNIDAATQLVNTIVNSIRCAICDALSGERFRHPCGHIICSSCAGSVTSCLHCLTPPSTSSNIVKDAPHTQLAKNTSELLDAFQDTFHVNVALQSRLMEQRKLEKEVFPACIQAPTVPYYNKKKSQNTSIKSKDRSSLLPGELMSGSHTMDKSKNYVQKWLEQHNEDLIKYQPRTPFSDISVNSPIHKSTPIKQNANLNQSENGKRSHFKTSVSPSSLLNNKSQPWLQNKRQKLEKSLWKTAKRFKKETKLEDKKRSKDESGIEMDFDTIVIEDSQTETLDKDKQALLAVIEADKCDTANIITSKHIEELPMKNKQVVSNSDSLNEHVLNWLSSETDVLTPKPQKIHQKETEVPISEPQKNHPESAILDPCSQCHNDSHNKSKNISIRIETNDLVTTVTVTNEQKPPRKVSKSVQTDIQDLGENAFAKDSSEEIFTAESKTTEFKPTEKIPEVTIPKFKPTKVLDVKSALKTTEIIHNDNKTVISESESEPEMGSSVLVQAMVHRSNDDVERGILTEFRDDENRTPRAPKRGRTPNSSDSSDKENRDPNRKKSRKEKNKKKKFRH